MTLLKRIATIIPIFFLSACITLNDFSESVDGSIILPGKADAETKQCIDNSSLMLGAFGVPMRKERLSIPIFDAAFLSKALKHRSTSRSANQRNPAYDHSSVVSKFEARISSLSEIRNSVTPAAEQSALGAQRILESDSVHSDIRRLTEYSAGTDARASSKLNFDRSDISSYSSTLQNASSNNGFLLAATGYAYVLQTTDWNLLATQDQGAVEADIARLYRLVAEASFLDTYFKAYFRDGKIFSARFDTAELRKKLIEKIDRQIPPADAGGEQERTTMIDELADNLLESILGGKPDSGTLYNLIGEIGETAFVTRGGTSYSFPGITVDINPLAENRVDSNEIDYTVIGSDIIRVAIEAVGDSWSKLPASENSTACKQDLLDCWKGESGPDNIFSNVNSAANKVEAIAGAATGKIIRGISWFSLNNEALAELIETTVAVAARKGSEKLAWCYYESKPEELAYSGRIDPTYNGTADIQIKLDAPRIHEN